jgi:hypothetical protein
MKRKRTGVSHPTARGSDSCLRTCPTPAEVIRLKCRDCVGTFSDQAGEIRNCTGYPDAPGASGCDIWPYRNGEWDDEGRGIKKLTRTEAIRAECVRCMGGNAKAVLDCPSETCAHHLWRAHHKYTGRTPMGRGYASKNKAPCYGPDRTENQRSDSGQSNTAENALERANQHPAPKRRIGA